MRNICKTPLQGNQAVLNFLTVAKPLWLTRIFIQNLKMVSSVRIFLSGRIRMVLILTQKKKKKSSWNDIWVCQDLYLPYAGLGMVFCSGL